MSQETYKEDCFEQTLMDLFREELGYETACGYDIERNLSLPFDEPTMTAEIQRLNKSLPQDAIAEALHKIKDIEQSTLVRNNITFMDYLQNGVDVESVKEQRTVKVQLIDFANPLNNHFRVINQWRVESSIQNIRCDMVVFVNGLPLVVIELKSPSNEDATIEDAYAQIKNYQLNCPYLFAYNAFCMISDFSETLAGTITSDRNRYMEWKTTDGNYETTDMADFRTPFIGMCEKTRLIKIIESYICFDRNEGRDAKIISAYHQFYAVNKAIERTHAAVAGNGKIGVFWHTQGSGKSLSMVFFAKQLTQQFPESTIVVVTDRKDLDGQLFGQFSRCKDFLRQTPIQAETCQHLTSLLDGRKAGGIFFTTIQKFTESDHALSQRRNIIVMTDEAHRSQYGDEHWDQKSQSVKKGEALKMREALPNASFVGFTGTPISDRDKDTQEVFGNYIDIYDMTQAVADGATRPVYYESRVLKLNLNEDILKQLDQEFDSLAEEGATDEQLNATKHELSRLEQVLGSDETLDSLVKDIITHYEENRANELSGKAMIVAYSREIAVDIYHRILAQRPTWTDKVHCVMSGSNSDPEEWHDLTGNDTYRSELAAEFKKEDSPFKIAIVRDMWLTGFDVPSLATMYVYKAMSGHNLMQAIARVNRVFPNKEGGLIVDYIGIAQALKKAMHDYTGRDRKNFGDPDIATTALNKWYEAKEICCDQLHGFDFTPFFLDDNKQKAQAITQGVNFLLAPEREEKRKIFVAKSQELTAATTLCRSLLTKEQKLYEAYFNAVRVVTNRLTAKGKVSKQQINERIGALLSQAIQSEGIVNLFEGKTTEFSLFDEVFMQQVAKMKEKNLAIEILKKLLREHITTSSHINVVESEKFSDLLNAALSNYLKGQISNEEVIEELLKLAKEIRETTLLGNKLGLTRKEKAFYDALTKPQAVKDFYTNEQLKQIVRDLTDMLQKNKTIDWNHKESGRAQMRKLVKRLLRQYNYPPEGAEEALEIVMYQCNKWADDEENFVDSSTPEFHYHIHANNVHIDTNIENVQEYK